jgi:hypothetical protein
MARDAQQETFDPGLDNSGEILLSLYERLPGLPPSSVPWQVRLLENPRSPCALPGAMDLFSHDCVHLLLGRGLLPQDEAFVLGFTMGTNPRCADWHVELYCWCARQLYPGDYRFSVTDTQVFRFAVDAARRSCAAMLEAVDFQRWLELPLGQVRAALGIEPCYLRRVYAAEAARWPGTVVSRRLPRSTPPRRSREDPNARCRALISSGPR